MNRGYLFGLASGEIETIPAGWFILIAVLGSIATVSSSNVQMQCQCQTAYYSAGFTARIVLTAQVLMRVQILQFTDYNIETAR